MNCPVCDVQLTISSREGVEIDYCGQCRGVWLDRGELDKIIERAAPSLAPAGREPDQYGGRRREEPWSDDRHRPYDDRRHDDRSQGKRRKRRGSFLEELFDFD
jgi:uncharacterized protein